MVSRIIQSYIPDLIAFRKELHRFPEVSNEEAQTAKMVRAYLAPFAPDEWLTGLGGHGLAACYRSENPGPTVMLRCELDALPITEINTFDHRSTHVGTSHKCGHDGHMSIMAGMARLLHEHPLAQGEVVLLFQPAEETGEGAKRVMQDKQFLSIKPDYAFALHNLPGYTKGHVVFKPGPMACASRGMRLKMIGKTSHAAWPEDGNSPAMAMSRIMEGLTLLSYAPALQHGLNRVNVVHATLGRDGFGTTPGDAEICATLRSDSEEGMAFLLKQSELLIEQWLAIYGLKHQISWSDTFELTTNDEGACDIITAAATASGLKPHYMQEPLRASEDFGVFTQAFPGALFGLGNGTQGPQLHNPDYDFPDDLIEIGIQIFSAILDQCMATAKTPICPNESVVPIE